MVFRAEILNFQNNEFLKPPAGITSITSTTEGTLGVIKKTTINFTVNNFTDYDKIYSRFFLNRSVYNLHYKKSIRFFTRGKDAVELIDQDGLIYLIGSQKAEELERSINNIINS